MDTQLDKDEQLIAFITLYSGVPSIISAICLICSYIIVRHLQVMEFKIIVYIQTGDLIITSSMVSVSIWYLSVTDQQPAQNYPLCLFFAFSRTFGALLSFTWQLNVSYLLYKTINQAQQDYYKNWKKIQIISFAIPFILATIPFIDHQYGYNNPSMRESNCFIVGVFSITRLFVINIPLWFVFIYSTYVSIKVIRYFQKTFNHPIVKRRVLHLTIYPVIFFICWSWLSILRIIDIFGLYNNTLTNVSYFFFNFYGFLNSVAYGCNAISDRSKNFSKDFTISSENFASFSICDEQNMQLLKKDMDSHSSSYDSLRNNGDQIQFLMVQKEQECVLPRN